MKKLIAGLICITILVSTRVGYCVAAAEDIAVNDRATIVLPPVDTFEGQSMEDLNMEDVRLLAAVIWAEAEGEDYTGKRLVASTVLNRVDDPRFPNTVFDVINQPGQFTVVGNGRLYTGYEKQEPTCVQAAMEELMSRTDRNVLFFCAYGWGYGTPYMQHGNHYFSTLWG